MIARRAIPPRQKAGGVEAGGMKYLVRVYFGAAALILALALAGALMPGEVVVTRRIEIDRPASAVYTLLSNPRAFPEWAPWAELDPAAEYAYDGPAYGAGARARWRGEHPGLRRGGQTITKAQPYDRVETALDFGERGRAAFLYELQPKGGGSEVVWTYRARLGLDVVQRAAAMFWGPELGRELDNGLANLKALAETLPGADFADAGAQLMEAVARPVVAVGADMRGDAGELDAAFAAALAKLEAYMAGSGLRPDGPVMAITRVWEPPYWSFQAAIPYAGPTRSYGDGPAQFAQSYGGRAVRAIHRGDPAQLPQLHAKLEAFIAAHRLEQNGGPWEVRVTNRAAAPAREQVTELWFPVK